jgi:hypothetical protein
MWVYLNTLFIILALICAPLSALAITEQEPNDQVWQSNPAVCGDTVICATIDPLPSTDCFRFSTLTVDSIILETFPCGGDVNTFLILYNDRDSIVATNDDGGPGHCSLIRYRAPGPAEYCARVMRGGPAPDSTYSLWISCRNGPPEDYDYCDGARIIEELPYYNEGSTIGATDHGGTASPDVFYEFYNPVVGNYTITVCTTLWDARAQVLGLCLGDYWDDANTGCGLGAVFTTYGLAVGQYFIMVEGVAANQQGDFSIEVEAFLPPCPTPEFVVVTRVGVLPFLDWPDYSGPANYLVYSAPTPTGPWTMAGAPVFSYFTDSSGYTSQRKFYQVTSVCPW